MVSRLFFNHRKTRLERLLSLSHTVLRRCSSPDDTPHPDGVLKNTVRSKFFSIVFSEDSDSFAFFTLCGLFTWLNKFPHHCLEGYYTTRTVVQWLHFTITRTVYVKSLLVPQTIPGLYLVPDYTKRRIDECRCDERLKPKPEGPTLLVYTGLCGVLEHLKIETRYRC
jgi:hypothetical protein